MKMQESRRTNYVIGRLIIAVGLILLCMGYSGCCNRNDNEERKETLPSDTIASAEKKETGKDQGSKKTSVKNVLIHIHNPGDFKKYVLDSKNPCLIDFYSDRCPPCRKLAPIIEKLAEEYEGKAVVCKVSLDISANRDVAAQYSFQYIPTVVFLKGGKEVERMTGLKSEDEYRGILDQMITEKASGVK